jgi:hypothetical protein
LTLNALTAADAVLIPVQCEYLALEGISQLTETSTCPASSESGSEIEGVVMTMYDDRTNLSKQVVDEVRSVFGDLVYKTVVPRNIRLGEAPSHGKPIFLYDIRSRGARRISISRRSSWSMKRKALGKGLSSLIPTSITKVPSDTAPPLPQRPTELRIEVSKIRPNPRQPRRSFDEGALDELARSVRTEGFLQPVVVRLCRTASTSSSRRAAMARGATRGDPQDPAGVRDVPDEKLLELALIENLQREELNAIEEAEAYRS